MAIKDLAQNVAIAGFTALGVEKLTDKAHELERMATGEISEEDYHKSAFHALLLYQQASHDLLEKIADALSPEEKGDIEESIVIPVYPQSLQLSRFGRPHSMLYVKSSINLFVEAPNIGQFTLTGLAVGWNQLDFADGVRISIPSGGSPTIALYRCSVNGIGATNPAGTTAPASNVTVTNFPSTQPVSGSVTANVSNFPLTQRVTAQSGDFPTGSIADLLTIAGAVSSGKMATKAAANDIVDLATLLTKFTNALDTNNYLYTHQKLGGADISQSNPMPGSLAVATALAAWTSQPTQTAAAGADTLLKFGSGGTTPGNHLALQNNNTITWYYSFDQDSTASTSQVYTLAPGQAAFWDRSFSVFHCHSASQVAIGGTSGFTIEAFS